MKRYSCVNCGGVIDHRPGDRCESCGVDAGWHILAVGEKVIRTLNQIGAESLACSAAKGFDTVLKADWLVPGAYYYDPERKGIVPTKLALIHSEVSEALEEFRKGHDLNKFGGELADIIIRVGQLGVGLGIDLDAATAAKQAANRERPHQHGGRLI